MPLTKRKTTPAKSKPSDLPTSNLSERVYLIRDRAGSSIFSARVAYDLFPESTDLAVEFLLWTHTLDLNKLHAMPREDRKAAFLAQRVTS